MPRSAKSDALRGSVDLLILKALSLGSTHGWGIGLRIQELSRDVLEVSQGSLYPALQRMKRKGWITSEWRTTEHNRQARYYRLTAAGARQLAAERESWIRASAAVNWVLGIEEGGA